MAEVVQIIKGEGAKDALVWKHYIEDFYTGTQLIVDESQEAIFFMNGQALDLFGAGRHTLTTQNIPLISKFFNKATNDQTPFQCKVYFINKTEQMGIKWGLDSKVNYLDSNNGDYPFEIGASGEMSLRVEDSRKLLVKLVGTESNLSQLTLSSYFKAPMMNKIKSYLPSILVKNKVNIFDIDQYMSFISDEIKQRLLLDFSDYGIDVSKFWITNFVKPESDATYKKLKDLRGSSMTAVQEVQLQQKIDLIKQETQAQKIVIDSKAQAVKRAQEGYTYQQERTYDVAKDMAQNEGNGEFLNAGLGLGMMGGMAGMGYAVAGMTTDLIKPVINATQADTADANAESNTDSTPTEMSAFKTKVDKIKIMYEAGLLSEEKYQEAIQELLNEIKN